MKDLYTVTPELVRHIARLAALDIDAQEEKRFVEELNHVLGYMRKLTSLNVEGIEATFQTLPMVNVLRPDEARPGLSSDEVLQNAPEREDQYLRMPPILEGEP